MKIWLLPAIVILVLLWLGASPWVAAFSIIAAILLRVCLQLGQPRS